MSESFWKALSAACTALALLLEVRACVRSYVCSPTPTACASRLLRLRFVFASCSCGASSGLASCAAWLQFSSQSSDASEGVRLSLLHVARV